MASRIFRMYFAKMYTSVTALTAPSARWPIARIECEQLSTMCAYDLNAYARMFRNDLQLRSVGDKKREQPRQYRS
jgi:hypothetical protein